MDIRIQGIYEALFALEDLREIFRNALPSGLDEREEEEVSKILDRLDSLLKDIRNKKGREIKYIMDKIELRTREEGFININPIQAGGRLTKEARKTLISYCDGYSVCDWCMHPFRLDKIKKPPIDEFHAELAEFLGMDVARVVPGARRGFQAVVSALVERGDSVIVSSLSHYTIFLAVEGAGGVVREVPSTENVITAESTAEKIEKVKKESGKLPKLIMIDHFDHSFGNEHDVYGIGKIAEEYDIPFLYNGAYSVGIMPVNGKKIGADFVVGSGHKSMASVAPSGVLAMKEEWAEKVLRTTEMIGDVTGRKFGIKEVEMMGCTLMGGTLLSMMASFPSIKERVKIWDEEVKKSNYFISEFLKIRGNKILSEYPRKHTLSKVDTRESFDKIAKKHKKKGYFLTEELKKKGITGLFPGSTRTWELNVYGLTWKQINYLKDVFFEIAEKYELEVE
ncbi:MAG: O-phospho-L-seryl-tRNA:Cys-tRNA synthase [Candidatus Syntropharchaeia archaeon]